MVFLFSNVHGSRFNFNSFASTPASKARSRKRKATNRKTGKKALKKGKEFTITEKLAQMRDSNTLHELEKMRSSCARRTAS